MKTFNDFDAALAEFRLDGGAMNYICAGMGSDDAWQVGDALDIEDATGENAHLTTHGALLAGGLTIAQASAEMHGWTD